MIDEIEWPDDPEITHWIFDDTDGQAYWAGGMGIYVPDAGGLATVTFAVARPCSNFGRMVPEGPAVVARP